MTFAVLSTDDALVSCLLVTKPDRFPLLVRSIEHYCLQTHTARELVILCSSEPVADRERLDRHLIALGRADVRLVEIPPNLTLGSSAFPWPLTSRDVRQGAARQNIDVTVVVQDKTAANILYGPGSVPWNGRYETLDAARR